MIAGTDGKRLCESCIDCKNEEEEENKKNCLSQEIQGIGTRSEDLNFYLMRPNLRSLVPSAVSLRDAE